MLENLTSKSALLPEQGELSHVESSTQHLVRGSVKIPATQKQYRVIKYPVKLTEEEVRKFNKTCMYLRWFWNDMLSYLNLRYKMMRCFGKVYAISKFGDNKIIKDWRNDSPDMAYLKNVPLMSIRGTSSSLMTAYTQAIKGRRNFPRFKSAKNRRICSITFPRILIKDEEVWLGGFLHCRARIWAHKKSEETIHSAKLVKNTGGFEVQIILSKDATIRTAPASIVGIDVGLQDLITTSDGCTWNFSKHTAHNISRLEKRLRYRKRMLSRSVNGSRNRVRYNIKVARTYARINRMKTHSMQTIAYSVVKTGDAFVIENFNPHNMCGGKMGNAIHNVAFGRLWTMIQHQASKAGKEVIRAPFSFPSSKLCSVCGEKNTALALSDREWTCKCGTRHNRDLNAAINLRNFGVKKLSERGNLSVKDGMVEIPPKECDAGKTAYGISHFKEGCKTKNQQWFRCNSVEPPGLANTVTRGNLVEGRKTLIEVIHTQ